MRGATLSPRAGIVQAVVSIHAPVRGATFFLFFFRRAKKVSIHAPVRGATAVTDVPGAVAYAFQSTRPCGARRKQRLTGSVMTRFNPRARAGRDPLTLVSSVTQNDPGSAIKMTPLPRLKKAVDQQIEFVNPESLFLPANESRR